MEEDFKILEGFCRNQNENSLEVFTLPPNAVERFLEELRRVPDTVGKCIIELVKKLQENENVEEPPGPRAEIATAPYTSALRVIGYSEEDALKTAIKLCVAPKLTAKNTLELVFREYENCPFMHWYTHRTRVKRATAKPRIRPAGTETGVNPETTDRKE